MRLLQDPWIPVRDTITQARCLLRYEELLCATGHWSVALPRDDLEMACVQLLVCLTQTLFTPAGDHELMRRLKSPLNAAEVREATAPKCEWFDLDHPDQPFMQARGVRATTATPIQKLLGLPEGASHAFFHAPGEVTSLGGAAAAIALFHQAANFPSFGGGFKSNLRSGRAPVTTLVAGRDLRETIWLNVLTQPRLDKLWPDRSTNEEDEPMWVSTIAPRQKISAHQIGLCRGLFWQPTRLELIAGGEGVCDVLGGAPQPLYTAFNKEKLVYEIAGFWPHPQSPRHLSLSKDETKEYHLWFSNDAPSWTLLSEFVVPRRSENRSGSEAIIPAPVVSQFCEVPWDESRPLKLMIGGYRNKQASILERRHELIGLAAGWADETQRTRLEALIHAAKGSRKALWDALYSAVKRDGKKSDQTRKIKKLGVPLHEVAGERFYQWSEPCIYAALRAFGSRRESRAAQTELLVRLRQEVCMPIFEDVTRPYERRPEFVPAIALARRSLGFALKKLEEAHSL